MYDTNMKMVSTRDKSRKAYSYTDVLISGLAPDGGLYVPLEYPKFSQDELKIIANATYPEIVFAVKKRLVNGAIPDIELKKIIDSAYSESFDKENNTIVPVSEIEPGLFLQNLSLGPTASFKDMALQILGKEIKYELARRKEKLTILGATSGDTGSAAEAAMKGLPNIKLFILSPEKGMSKFQRAQMGNLTGDNIFNISIRGTFDDCQDLVKQIKRGHEFSHLGAVNSINWGRISSQIPYYFAGYFQTVKKVGEPIDVTVPSGNFGNMLSAYIAKRMGLPIRRLIVATNENNVLDTLFKTGVYERKTIQVTSSPSMDISKASNYERLVFDIFKGDAELVKKYMAEFAKTGRVSLTDYGLDKDIFIKLGFGSGNSTHKDRLATIKHIYEKSAVVIDPHTADGVFVGRKHMKSDNVPMLCMGTALPVKFEETVEEAIGFIPKRPERFLELENSTRENCFEVMDVNSDILKEFLKSHI